MYSFIQKKRCPFGCETYLPKSNTELESQLPKELPCPHCNQVFKINDLNKHTYECPKLSVKQKRSLLNNRITKLKKMIYDLKEKKFIIPNTKDIPSRMSFGNHPHKLCHIISKHNKVCDNC